jgi:hypothetical protein
MSSINNKDLEHPLGPAKAQLISKVKESQKSQTLKQLSEIKEINSSIVRKREILKAVTHPDNFSPVKPRKTKVQPNKIEGLRELENINNERSNSGSGGSGASCGGEGVDMEVEANKLAEAEYFNSYSSKVRYSLFAILFLSNVMINIDHGTLPGGSDGIKFKANINNWSFGVLGSIVYLGLTLGSAVASAALSSGGLIKPTIAATLFLNAACLYGFTTTTSFYTMVLIRGLVGFF